MRTFRSLFIIVAAIILVTLLGGCSVADRQHTALHDHHATVNNHLDSEANNHDRIARSDMDKRTAHDLPHSVALAGTFGRAERWSSDWELRWIDYQTPAGVVRVYHATSRHGDDLRYISHWAYDEAHHHPWEPIH